MEDTKIRKSVREGYANIARRESSCCSPVNSCCAPAYSNNKAIDQASDISKKIGYSEEELRIVPEGSNLGFHASRGFFFFAAIAGPTSNPKLTIQTKIIMNNL